jgi:hypothetical protein
MHQRIYAERSAKAQARIVAAAAELGNRFGLADAAGRIATIQSNQPHLKVLFEREAVADLLEALASTPVKEVVADGAATSTEAKTALKRKPATKKSE